MSREKGEWDNLCKSKVETLRKHTSCLRKVNNSSTAKPIVVILDIGKFGTHTKEQMGLLLMCCSCDIFNLKILGISILYYFSYLNFKDY